MGNLSMTNRQRAFVDAYCGDAHFNATEAAILAGYSKKNAKSIGYENLNKPAVRAAVQAYLDSLRTEGLRVKEQRIEELQRLDRGLLRVQTARAERAQAAYEAGEDVPAEALTGLCEEVVKTFGTGPTARIERVWQVDKTLLQERQRIATAIQKEMGDHIERIQISGALSVESAKQKLLGE